MMDASVATILAAAIGAAIALVGLVANKQNKTSEFRQQWIDALRQDIASFVGILFAIEGGVEDANRATETLSTLSTRIYLRFKYQDKDSDAFRHAMTTAISSMINDRQNFKKSIDELVDESQKLLRQEWLVVKKGEPLYRLLVGTLITLCAVFAVVVIRRYIVK